MNSTRAVTLVTVGLLAFPAPRSCESPRAFAHEGTGKEGTQGFRGSSARCARSTVKLLAIVLIATTVSACAVSRGSFAPITVNHPASLHAEEGDIADPGKSLIAIAHPVPMGEHTGSEGAVSSAHYVCPMHPDVSSDSPGKCPRCGMALKEKKPDAGQEGHVHDHH